MKNRRRMTQVIALVLVIMMLAGFAPASSMRSGSRSKAPDEASSAIVLDNDVSSETEADESNDVSTDTEPGEAADLSSDTSPETGSDKTDDIDVPDPDVPSGNEGDDEGGQPEQASISLKLMVSSDVVAKLDGKPVVSGEAMEATPGESVLTMELADAYKGENEPEAYAFLIDGKKVTGASYTIPAALSESENPELQVAVFGILKVEVENADAWTQSKKVTVTTLGEAKKVTVGTSTVSVSDNHAVFNMTTEQKDSGTDYDVKVASEQDSINVEKLVNVKKIDTTAPSVKKATSKVQSRVSYTITFEEAGSGLSLDKITIIGRYGPGQKVSSGEIDKSLVGNTLTFSGPASMIGSFFSDYPVSYSITVVDKAGNKFGEKSMQEILGDDDYEEADVYAPTIQDVRFAADSYTEAGNVYYTKSNKITIQVKDTAGQFAYAGLKSVGIKQTSGSDSDWEAVKEGFSKAPRKGDPVTEEVTFTLPEGAESGTYQITAIDRAGYAGKHTISVVYDTTAPEMDSVTLNEQDRSAFGTIVHALTGGVLCHEKVSVTIDYSDNVDADVTICYQFEGQEEVGSISSKDLENGTFVVDVPSPTSRENKGKLTVWVVDKAMNESAHKTVQYTFVESEGSQDAEFTTVGTNTGTGTPVINANGDVVVFAYYPENGTETAYPADAPWTPYVKFDVRYDTKGLLKDYNFTGTEAAGETRYRFASENKEQYDLSANLTASGLTSTVPGTLNSGDVNQAKWTVSFGENGDVSYVGDIRFDVTVTYNLVKQEWKPAVAEEKNEETGEITTPAQPAGWYDVEGGATAVTGTASVAVPVKVQNYLPNAVAAQEEQLDNNAVLGWYNANGQDFPETKLARCGGLAPAETTYEIYWQSLKDYNAEEPWEVEENIVNEGVMTDPAVTGDLRALITGDKDQRNGVFIVKVTSAVTEKNLQGIRNDNNEQVYFILYDSKAPLIKALFENVDKPTTTTMYYNVNRKVTVSISDECFVGGSPDEATSAIDIPQSWGADEVVLGDWTFTAGKDADGKDIPSGGTWTKVFGYGRDTTGARDGDEYKLTISAEDVAKNVSKTDENGNYFPNGSEKSAGTAYTGDGHEDVFTVDQTIPVVTVSFDNNAVRNGKYFNRGRTATITVVDHNFEPKQVDLKVTGASAGSNPSEGWNKSGEDTWVKTVSFTHDANCTFEISVTDLAGNTCPDSAVTYNGQACKDFVIDLTAPSVTYTGTDESPYSDVCTPGFTATDTNLGNEFTYHLTRSTLKEGKDVDVSDKLPHGGTSSSFSYSDIDHALDQDGIYTLTVTVTDLAGNTTTLEPVTFAVNRHGSVFVASDELNNKVIGKYLNAKSWDAVKKNLLKIAEYNPTELADDAKLEIYRDNERIKTYTGAELKKLVSGGDIGSVGLYEYVYALPAEDFEADGVYRVVISSTDAAGHHSDSTKAGAEISFVIDTASPEIVSITGLEKPTQNAKVWPVKFHVMDTYGINSVQIRLHGPDSAVYREYITQAQLDAQDGKLKDNQVLMKDGELDIEDEIELKESNEPYHVVITVIDKAGNETVAYDGEINASTAEAPFEPSYDFLGSVTVSTNFFVRYIHNTAALVGTGVGAAAAAAALWLIISRKKKKKEA